MLLHIEIITAAKINYQSSLAPLHIFMTSLWQETFTHGQHGQGAPQSQVGKHFFFFFFSCKNSVEVWMKQSQVTEQLQSSFPWSSLWRLCGPSSTPVTPAGLKAAISSTCLYFCSYKSLNFGPPCLSSLGRLCFFGPGFIILSVIPKL